MMINIMVLMLLIAMSDTRMTAPKVTMQTTSTELMMMMVMMRMMMPMTEGDDNNDLTPESLGIIITIINNHHHQHVLFLLWSPLCECRDSCYDYGYGLLLCAPA